MYTDNLEAPILLEPAFIGGRACNRLKIITGFTDIERISDHLIKLYDGMNDKTMVSGIQVEMILGMTKGIGLSRKKHESICKLVSRINSTKGMPRFICRYIVQGKLVHSKVYIWLKGRMPEIAFSGSANYSINAFYKRRECMDNCDPVAAMKYYKELRRDTLDCMDPNVLKKVRFSSSAGIQEEISEDNLENLEWSMFTEKEPLAELNVSLLKADGKETGYGSGVNWGIRPNGLKRNPNQAYIPYNKRNRLKDFFPDKINETDKTFPVFKVVTKNYGAFLMRRAQADGKGLHTPESNAIIGEMLRCSLGVPDGTYITKKMLEEYGKTYVTFRKYENNIYTLDF